MKKLLIGILSGALFAGFTYLVRTYDVAAIGPDGTTVGFSTINNKIHNLTGVNMKWYDLTDYFGYLAIGIAALFALVGLVQWIKRKNLFKVDREIICLGILFVVVIGFYVGFEHFVINCRPVIMPDATAPEASYPSSHTMLIITVMGAAMMLIKRYMGSGFFSGLLRLICLLVIIVTVAGRLYSGVHWFTDIVGGCLLSISLISLYGATVRPYEKTPKDKVQGTMDGYLPKH